MRYTSPTGEVLDVPAGGGHSLIALGWEPDAEEKPARRTRRRKAEDDASGDDHSE